MFNLGVGGSFLWWVWGRGNGLEDKINIPFVLLATPAVRKIMLEFFFENGNCQYAFSITHLVYSFFFGFWNQMSCFTLRLFSFIKKEEKKSSRKTTAAFWEVGVGRITSDFVFKNDFNSSPKADKRLSVHFLFHNLSQLDIRRATDLLWFSQCRTLHHIICRSA